MAKRFIPSTFLRLPLRFILPASSSALTKPPMQAPPLGFRLLGFLIKLFPKSFEPRSQAFSVSFPRAFLSQRKGLRRLECCPGYTTGAKATKVSLRLPFQEPRFLSI